MKRTALLVLAVVLAAIGVFFWTARDSASDRAAIRLSHNESESSKETETDRLEPAQVVRAPTNPPAELGPSPIANRSTRTAAPGQQRKVDEEDKRIVRALIKQFGAAPEPVQPELRASGAADAAWPTDEDSLLIKYGSLGVDGVDEVITSWNAILEWQDQGPFDSKEAEQLPAPLRTAIEQELEWLRSYRATM